MIAVFWDVRTALELVQPETAQTPSSITAIVDFIVTPEVFRLCHNASLFFRDKWFEKAILVHPQPGLEKPRFF